MTQSHFIWRHLGWLADPLTKRVWGGSRSIDEGDLSAVGRSLIKNAWPPEVKKMVSIDTKLPKHTPILFALPGTIWAVVTPPDMDSW